jgi:hypothetical protein
MRMSAIFSVIAALIFHSSDGFSPTLLCVVGIGYQAVQQTFVCCTFRHFFLLAVASLFDPIVSSRDNSNFFSCTPGLSSSASVHIVAIIFDYLLLERYSRCVCVCDYLPTLFPVDTHIISITKLSRSDLHARLALSSRRQLAAAADWPPSVFSYPMIMLYYFIATIFEVESSS